MIWFDQGIGANTAWAEDLRAATAHKVDRLLHRPEVYEQCRQACQTFYEKLTAWQQAVGANDKTLGRVTKKLDELIFKKIHCAEAMEKILQEGLQGPSKEYKRLRAKQRRIEAREKDAKDALKDALEEAKAGLPDPGPSPLDWLELPAAYEDKGSRGVLDYLFSTLDVETGRLDVRNPPGTAESQRLRTFVLLVIFRDKELEGAGYQRIAEGIWPADEPFVTVVWNKMTATDVYREFRAGGALWRNEIDALIEEAERYLPTVTPPKPAANETGDTGQGAVKYPFVRYLNEVPWNDKDPAYYHNTNAIADAHEVGNKHEIDNLSELDLDKLYKLLRSSDGRAVHFMSQRYPPRGKVHKSEWTAHLRRQVEEHERFDQAVEKETIKRL